MARSWNARPERSPRWQIFSKHNQQNRGIYFVVMAAMKMPISPHQCTIVERDEPSIEEKWRRLRRFPSTIADCKTKIPSRLPVDEDARSRIFAGTKRLTPDSATRPASTKVACPLPGFNHRKAIRQSASPNRVALHIGRIKAVLPEVPTIRGSKHSHLRALARDWFCDQAVSLQTVADNANPLRARWYAMITNLRCSKEAIMHYPRRIRVMTAKKRRIKSSTGE